MQLELNTWFCFELQVLHVSICIKKKNCPFPLYVQLKLNIKLIAYLKTPDKNEKSRYTNFLAILCKNLNTRVCVCVCICIYKHVYSVMRWDQAVRIYKIKHI